MELTMKMVLIFLCLLALPSAAAVSKAHRSFLAGVEAHISGKEDKALRHWKLCLKRAEPGSMDENSCRLYGGMFGPERVVDAPGRWPQARETYRAGIAAYRRKDYSEADRLWHDCLSQTEAGTGARNDCLVALELVLKPLPPPATAPLEISDEKAHQAFIEGMEYFVKNDTVTTRRLWLRCLDFALPGGESEAECENGLKVLVSSGPASR